MVEKLGYFGVPLLLILGGLGLPIPEEGPIILAAVLSKHETLWTPLAFLSCLIGVLVGDFIVYGLGYIYGERVLQFRLTRQFLSREREVQIKGYFHRHGFKILVLGRFAVGFRTAAYLTAGILRLGALRLLAMDTIAALLSTSLFFGLGYVFTHQIEALIKAAEHALAWILGACIAGVLLYRYIKGRSRSRKLVGPPVPVDDVDEPASTPPPTPEPPPPLSPAEPEPKPGAEPAPTIAAGPDESPAAPAAVPSLTPDR